MSNPVAATIRFKEVNYVHNCEVFLRLKVYGINDGLITIYGGMVTCGYDRLRLFSCLPKRMMREIMRHMGNNFHRVLLCGE